MSDKATVRQLKKPYIGLCGSFCLICGKTTGKCFSIEFKCDCLTARFPTDIDTPDEDANG